MLARSRCYSGSFHHSSCPSLPPSSEPENCLPAFRCQEPFPHSCSSCCLHLQGWICSATRGSIHRALLQLGSARANSSADPSDRGEHQAPVEKLRETITKGTDLPSDVTISDQSRTALSPSSKAPSSSITCIPRPQTNIQPPDWRGKQSPTFPQQSATPSRSSVGAHQAQARWDSPWPGQCSFPCSSALGSMCPHVTQCR